jgi:hypothetical protein
LFSGTAEADSTGDDRNWTSHTLDVTGLADGTITVSATATATDAAGNTSSVGSTTTVKDTLARGAPAVLSVPVVNVAR